MKQSSTMWGFLRMISGIKNWDEIGTDMDFFMDYSKIFERIQ